MSVSREARAYIAGLTRRLAQGEDVARIASLASFFVSRVDTTVDHPVEALGTERARHARGWAAIANAKMAYQAHRDIFEGAEFKELRAAGAHVQRCLWGSTSTKTWSPTHRSANHSSPASRRSQSGVLHGRSGNDADRFHSSGRGPKNADIAQP